MTLAERLKLIRESLGMSQSAMAKAADSSLPSWQGYEAGRNVPGGKVLEALARMGFNINWVLTGEGEMKKSFCGWWEEKIKEMRGSMSIPEFVDKANFNDKEYGIATIQAIEGGKMEPDWGLMVMFSQELGINPVWMIDGDGPMLKKDVPTGEKLLNRETTDGIAIDKEFIKEALLAVEEYLQEVKGTLPPDKKAELVMLLCELLMKESPENRKINKATVISLVRLAA